MQNKIDIILDSDVSWTFFTKLIFYIYIYKYKVQLQVNFNIFHCSHFEPVPV
jgi:hypothetical protein